MNTQPIGVLDSGVGGLTVWKEILNLLPSESTIYIGDSKNAPYGPKDREEILSLASQMIEFLLSQDVKLIVIACNTITVNGIDTLRKKFSQIPIIGTVPVIKRAAEVSKTGTIGVLSTTATAKSEYQKSLIEQFSAGKKVINRGTNMLVPLLENGELDTPDVQKIVAKELSFFTKEDVDVLALGCTHFPFLKSMMQEILGSKVQLLDSGEAIARQVQRVLEHNHAQSDAKKPHQKIFTTGDVEILKRLARQVRLPKAEIGGVLLGI